jgi:D-aspartate ligase
VPKGRAIPGRGFIVENHDPLASWQYRRDDGLTLREWRRSLAGVRETAWFAADDPVPFLVMCLRFLLTRITGMLAGRQRRASAGPRPVTPPRYVRGRRRRPAVAAPAPIDEVR